MFTKASPSQQCLICFKPLLQVSHLRDLFEEQDVLCRDCRSTLVVDPIIIKMNDFDVYSIYPYEDSFQKILIQYKDLFDEALAPLFLNRYIKQLKPLIKSRQMVCIPSYPQHVKERGFHHVESMYKEVSRDSLQLLSKVSSRHQAKMSLNKRTELLFQIKSNSPTSILLVDDMCTTGESLRQAYMLLTDHGHDVKCVSVGYHPLLKRQFPYKKWF